MHMVAAGSGSPILFVHGLGCSAAEWSSQIAFFSDRHEVIAVDLPGHGDTPGAVMDCSIERYGTAVADMVLARNLTNIVVIGHSMGCRVATEAAVRLSGNISGLVLIDGSQLADDVRSLVVEKLGTAEGYRSVTEQLFQDFFTSKTDPRTVETITNRERRLPRDIMEKMLLDGARYDSEKFMSSLAAVTCPVLAVQSTATGEHHKRRTLMKGQTSPYLDNLRLAVPSVRIEIVEDTGHFPQIDEPEQTNSHIDAFVRSVIRT
jgi:pimeloyl-ACP methyl ester carboxylesterase